MSSNETAKNEGLFRRRYVKTTDGVKINTIEAGNATGRPILFVHGISQSWRSWSKQFESAELRASHRLIALDLRGHGQSQGAIGAFDEDGTPFPPLSGEFYNNGNPAATSSLWASDVIAVIDGLELTDFLLVGWSYGGVVVQDYLAASGGLGKAKKVLLLSTIPGLLPPGTPDIGGDVVFTPAAVESLMRTTTLNMLSDPPNPNNGRTIIGGLTDFIAACAVDVRSDITDEELLAALAFNVATPASVRLAIMGRAIDNRNFFSTISDRDREHIVAITGDADGIFNGDILDKLWRSCGVNSQLWPGEGHMLMARNVDFNNTLLQLAL